MPPPETAKRPGLHDDAPTSSESFRSAARRLSEIKDYISYYFSAKIDACKSSLKTAVLLGIFGLLAAAVGAAILATAAALIVLGISDGLTLLFGGRVWLADLVTGICILAVVLSATYFIVLKILDKSRAAMKEKYESLKRRQQAKHGHNVTDRAVHESAKTANP